MTAALSARNQSTYFALTSLTALSSEIESIPTHFSRTTTNIGETLAGVQSQVNELNRVRNDLLHDLEKLQTKTTETEQAQFQVAIDLEGAVEEATGLSNELEKLNGQVSSEKADNITFSREVQNLTAQKSQLQLKVDDICREIEVEISELSDLKKAKKDAKRDKAGQKKRIEYLVTALLSASAEAERLKDLISSLKRAHAAHQAKGQSIANDLRGRESGALQQKLMSLNNALEEWQEKLRFSLQSQAQLKKRVADRQSQSSSRIHDGLKAQLQQLTADDIRFKLENQGLRRRQAEIDRTFLERQAEFSQAMEELNHEKTLTMEHRSHLSAKMSDAQRTLAQDDDEIRRLTVEVNELTVSVELTQKRQAAAKKLKQHIKKTEAEMQSYAKPSAPSGNTNKRRVLKLD
jgi:chromosome segregation ATPase